jgi:hypothetical protein
LWASVALCFTGIPIDASNLLIPGWFLSSIMDVLTDSLMVLLKNQGQTHREILLWIL